MNLNKTCEESKRGECIRCQLLEVMLWKSTAQHVHKTAELQGHTTIVANCGLPHPHLLPHHLTAKLLHWVQDPNQQAKERKKRLHIRKIYKILEVKWNHC